jgi:hypothetical protein
MKSIAAIVVLLVRDALHITAKRLPTATDAHHVGVAPEAAAK